MISLDIRKLLFRGPFELFWAAAPLLLLLATLSMSPLPFMPRMLFAAIAIAAILSSYLWKMSGAFAGILVLFASYFLLSFINFPEHMLWDLGWLSSLSTAIFVFTLICEEFDATQSVKVLEFETRINEEQKKFLELENKTQDECFSFEEKCAKLREDLEEQEETIKSYQNLIDAKSIESEKFLYQNEKLVEESLLFHRTIARLEQDILEKREKQDQLEATREKLTAVTIKCNELEKQSQKHLEEQRLATTQPDEPAEDPEVDQYFEKETERKQIKISYDSMYLQFSSLKVELEKFVKEAGDTQSVDFTEKKKTFESIKMELQGMKRQVIDLDRELFILKKEMQGKGISV
ncbi:MAG: hypothetical protein KAR79_02335 [Simkaniaceae bacterium]|nr:hypothetical protein [Simkaniaceae bacterium]